MTCPAADADPVVETLAELFRAHEAWIAAARVIDPDATSDVYFRHRPGEAWHLERGADGTRLLAGPSPHPDLVFRFSPGAVARLAATRGGVGAFAVELFERVVDEDPERHVDLRIVSDFRTLVARGYLRLLLGAGPRVAAFGLAHGVAGLSGLRRLVAELRRRPAADWETRGACR